MEPKDMPNFASWSNKNLADFCAEAYIRMQEQQEAIEQYRQDLKDAMKELRKQAGNGLNVSNTVAPAFAKGSPGR